MSFEPENELERSLVAASQDPAQRYQFYKDLLEAVLYIVEEGQIPESSEKKVLTEGTTLKIQNVEYEGKPYVPVFSSLTQLQAAIDQEKGYIALNARDFLECIQGSEMILNPGSQFGKIFLRDEISSLLDGSMFERHEKFVVEEQTELLIGRPKNYPRELVQALARYFATRPEVRAAYLVHCYNPKQDVPPHSLIGVEVKGDWDEAMAGAGLVVDSVEVPDPPVDFMRIQPGNSFAQSLKSETKPFYRKKLFGLF